MGTYFHADGFRGEANLVLTPERAFKVGRFLGWYFGKQHPGERAQIAIGKDTRRSSYMLEDSLSAGITASGGDAYLIHVTTLPSVSYVVRTGEMDCGIMISASHNPYYDNGIRLIRSDGLRMEREIEEMIDRYIDGDWPEIPYAVRDGIGRTVDYAAGRNRYIGHLITIPSRSFKNMRIGLDVANGSASSVARSVFEALGAKVYVINDQPDGLNINRNCGSTHIEGLQKLVRDEKLDAGFALDGDADRCIAVDEHGKAVDGDGILYICGKHMMEMGRLDMDTIVLTVMSNTGLLRALEAAGIRTVRTGVGDRLVAACMAENGYRLGGEQSGHIIFSKYEATGDGILTALMLVQTMLDRKMPLSVMTADLILLPQILKNVIVKDKAAAIRHPAVVSAVEEAEKKLAGTGRVLVRESGTENCVRVMAEAASDVLCRETVDDLINVFYREKLTAEE